MFAHNICISSEKYGTTPTEMANVQLQSDGTITTIENCQNCQQYKDIIEDLKVYTEFTERHQVPGSHANLQEVMQNVIKGTVEHLGGISQQSSSTNPILNAGKAIGQSYILKNFLPDGTLNSIFVAIIGDDKVEYHRYHVESDANGSPQVIEEYYQEPLVDGKIPNHGVQAEKPILDMHFTQEDAASKTEVGKNPSSQQNNPSNPHVKSKFEYTDDDDNGSPLDKVDDNHQNANDDVHYYDFEDLNQVEDLRHLMNEFNLYHHNNDILEYLNLDHPDIFTESSSNGQEAVSGSDNNNNHHDFRQDQTSDTGIFEQYDSSQKHHEFGNDKTGYSSSYSGAGVGHREEVGRNSPNEPSRNHESMKNDHHNGGHDHASENHHSSGVHEDPQIHHDPVHSDGHTDTHNDIDWDDILGPDIDDDNDHDQQWIKSNIMHAASNDDVHHHTGPHHHSHDVGKNEGSNSHGHSSSHGGAGDDQNGGHHSSKHHHPKPQHSSSYSGVGVGQKEAAGRRHDLQSKNEHYNHQQHSDESSNDHHIYNQHHIHDNHDSHHNHQNHHWQHNEPESLHQSSDDHENGFLNTLLDYLTSNNDVHHGDNHHGDYNHHGNHHYGNHDDHHDIFSYFFQH